MVLNLRQMQEPRFSRELSKTLMKMKMMHRTIPSRPRDSYQRVFNEQAENLTSHSKLFQAGKAMRALHPDQIIAVAPICVAEAVASPGIKATSIISITRSLTRRTLNGSTLTQRKKSQPSSVGKSQAKLSCASNLKSKKTDTCSTSARTRTRTLKTRWTRCSSRSLKRMKRFVRRQKSWLRLRREVFQM